MRTTENRPSRFTAFRAWLKEFLDVQFRFRALLGTDYEEYRTKRESRNFTRAVVGSAALLVINLSGFMVFGKLASDQSPRPLFYQRLHLLYTINSGTALVFLALALGLAFGFGLGLKKGSTAHGFYCRAFLVWIYLIGIEYSINGQGYHNQILNLFFSLMLGAVAFSIPHPFSLLSHLAQFIGFYFLLRLFQPDAFLFNTNAFNAFTSTVFAAVFSRVIFSADLHRFLQDKSLLRKNLELRRQKNLNLLLSAANERGLTSREIELVKLLFTGKSNKEIAGVTNVEVDTVKKHFSSIFRKCNVASRVELLLFFGIREDDPAAVGLPEDERVPASISR